LNLGHYEKENADEDMNAAQLDQIAEDDSVPLSNMSNSCCNHNSCMMSSFKGARNGFYYGSRLRFAHAFVMSILFGKGPLEDRFKWAVNMAYNHGKLLSIYVFSYKTA
jgi:hypothetical protein